MFARATLAFVVLNVQNMNDIYICMCIAEHIANMFEAASCNY